MPLRKPHEVEWDNQNVRDYAIKQAEERGEHSKAAEVAKALKEQGYSLEFIAKVTGLLIEDIQQL